MSRPVNRRGFVALAALLIAGCGTGAPPAPDVQAAGGAGDPLAELVSAAQAEGEVVFYGGFAVEILESLQRGFADAYGINLVFQNSVSGQTKQRAEQEITAGRVGTDVIAISDDPAWQEQWAEHFVALTPEEIPAMADVPGDFKGDKWVHAKQDYYGFAYNTDELAAEDIPDDIRQIVTDERYRNRIGTVHPTTSNAFLTWHYLLHEQWGQPEYEAFWREFLGPWGGRTNDSVAPLVNQVAAGELLLAGPTNYGQISGLVSQGAPVDMAYRDPVISLGSSTILFADAPHPNAARLFLNWLLSEEGQAIFCSEQRCASYLELAGESELPPGLEVAPAPAVADVTKLGADYVVPFINSLG